MRTFDPYDEVTRPRLGIFDGLPSAPPGTVLVVDREGKPLWVLASHNDRLTAGEARFGRIRTIYRVVVAERQLEFTDAYPCQNAGTFTASLQLTCRVTDPAAVVVRGIHDVAAVVVPRVTETIRGVCRTFPAEAYADAETAALAAIRTAESGPRHDAALHITDVSLALGLDDDAAAFVAKLKENERTGVLMRSDTELASIRALQEAELTRQREELRAQQNQLLAEHEQAMLQLQKDREAQEAELAHARMLQEAALENERLELQIKRDELTARSQLEIERIRADHYLRLLARGDYAVLAMQLSQDPSSIERVAHQLAQRQSAEAQQQLMALKMFLDADALEAMDVSDKAKQLLARLAEGWTRGTPQLAGSSTPELLGLNDPGTASASEGSTPADAPNSSGSTDPSSPDNLGA